MQMRKIRLLGPVGAFRKSSANPLCISAQKGKQDVIESQDVVMILSQSAVGAADGQVVQVTSIRII